MINNEMTVLSVTALFPETKKEQDSFVEQLINFVLDGNVDPLKIEAQIVNMEAVIKKYRSDSRIRERLLSEAEKYHKEELNDLYNASFIIKEVGVKYDYSLVGHPEYNDLLSIISDAKERMKTIENYLKSLKNETVFIDSRTGEEVILYPPKKTSNTQVVTTIK